LDIDKLTDGRYVAEATAYIPKDCRLGNDRRSSRQRIAMA